MTDSLAGPPALIDHHVVRQAQRAWFRSGVRRNDRRLLKEELVAELTAAGHETATADLLGPDPRLTATAWARAKTVADRRLRLAAFLVPTLLAGAVGAGSVLAFLADAFTADGRTAIGSPGIAVVLALYIGSALLAVGAMLATTWLILRAFDDDTATLTVKMLGVALPPGGIIAAAVGIVIAHTAHFTTRPRTFIEVGIGVLVTLTITVIAARATAVRLHHRRTSSRSPQA